MKLSLSTTMDCSKAESRPKQFRLPLGRKKPRTYGLIPQIIWNFQKSSISHNVVILFLMFYPPQDWKLGVFGKCYKKFCLLYAFCLNVFANILTFTFFFLNKPTFSFANCGGPF